ncbi:flagellar protein FlaG [Salibacterium halotolerans]|uniref:Flagellar protein FlaG n=1 Tax=Salibacterium halotolerans TaxID=1884432 RepID=A0A1I5VUQ8_9BACI|nr:flagellar protein FlaG [Salibacterium halotolerans]SFQ11190.1 flagellar protein FlaG [Salibacterium halotolerans]
MGAPLSGTVVSDVMRTGQVFGGQVSMNDSASGTVSEKTQDESSMMPDMKTLREQADEMNGLLEATFTDLKFNVHDKLEQVYVQVLNRDTDEVIREVPPEKFLDMKAAILEQAGLLVDEKA